ncbi:MAG: 30S ribosomal protein S11 [Verrucomicrobiota bacterium]
MAEEEKNEGKAAEESAAATPAAEVKEEAATAPAEESKAETTAPDSSGGASEAKEATAGAEESGTTAEGEGEGEAKKEERPRTAEDVFLALEGDEEKPKILKAKGSKNVRLGIVHVQATYNNTKVSVTDLNGNVVGWSSSGKLGFRGSRKSTAYASQLVSQDACRQAMGHGLKSVEVRVKGPGAGRESAVRAIQNLGIEVTVIKDVTPVPHNGCRPRKPRRV